MKKIFALTIALLLIPCLAFSYFGGARFGTGEFGITAFSTGPFGEGGGLTDDEILLALGATFIKHYDINQSSLDADESTGSPTATFTASRGASNPATTIETQQGNALLFDGVDDSVDLGRPASLNFTPRTDAFSIFVKFKSRKDFNGTLYSFGAPSTSTDRQIHAYIQTSDSRIVIVAGGTKSSFSTVMENDDEFHTVLITVPAASSGILGYVDGVVDTFNEGTGLIGTATSGENGFIGSRTDSSTFIFSDQIKNIKIFNRELVSAEATTLNNGGSVTDGLVSHWDFSDGSGSTLTDIVGGNNGTITGAKWLTDGSTYVTKVTSSNTARFTTGFYDASGFTAAPGLLLEGAGTNLLTASIFDTDTAGKADDWLFVETDITGSPTYTVIAETLTNISGSQSQRIEYIGVAGDVAAQIATIQTTGVGSFSQNDTATISAWLKGSVGSGNSLRLRIRIRTAADAQIATVSGSDIASSLSSTEWRRFKLSATSADANFSRIKAEVVLSSIDDGDGAIDLNIAAFQTENAAFPSSFIPTTSAALTRNQEDLSYPVASNFESMTQGTIGLIFRHIMLPTEQAIDNKTLWSISIDGSNQFNIRYETNANNSYLIQVISGGAQDNINGTSGILGTTRYEEKSIIIGYSTTADANSKKKLAYIDGVLDKDSATYTAPVGTLPSSFTIQPEGNQAMILTSIALFNKRLNAAEALQVHNILTQ